MYSTCLSGESNGYCDRSLLGLNLEVPLGSSSPSDVLELGVGDLGMSDACDTFLRRARLVEDSCRGKDEKDALRSKGAASGPADKVPVMATCYARARVGGSCVPMPEGCGRPLRMGLEEVSG